MNITKLIALMLALILCFGAAYAENADAGKEPAQETSQAAEDEPGDEDEDGEDDAAREVLESAENLYYSAVCSVSEDMMEALKREVG